MTSAFEHSPPLDLRTAVPSRRRLLIAAALAPAFAPALASLAGCASNPTYLGAPVGAPIAGPGQPAEAPRVRVGERWRYESVNRYNNQPTAGLVATVAEATPGTGLKLALTTLSGQPIGEEWYADPWRVLQDYSFDGLQVFDRPVPIIPARLQAGVQETMSASYQVIGASAHFAWSQRLKAPTWERIRVPAGEFDCLRVERLITFQPSDPFRILPERWDTLWYAPAVNRWVQREWTGYYLTAGYPPVRSREDWVLWRLLDHTAPAA